MKTATTPVNTNTAPATKRKQIPVCSHCGSHDIQRNADVVWSEEDQDWEIAVVFDSATCEDCGGECSIEWIDADMPAAHQHTPGPWYENKGSGGQGLVISEPTGETVAVTYKEKDARPIAAFPDLLAACQTAVEIIRDSYGEDDVSVSSDCQAVNVLEQAIAKATETQ